MGKPGRLGKNEVRTEVYMDIRNIKDEIAPVQEVDVIVGGRVVERDYYQAGHMVERDRTSSQLALERDIVTSDGRIIEKDYLVKSTTDRNYIGLSGKTVERQRS